MGRHNCLLDITSLLSCWHCSCTAISGVKIFLIAMNALGRRWLECLHVSVNLVGTSTVYGSRMTERSGRFLEGGSPPARVASGRRWRSLPNRVAVPLNDAFSYTNVLCTGPERHAGPRLIRGADLKPAAFGLPVVEARFADPVL